MKSAQCSLTGRDVYPRQISVSQKYSRLPLKQHPLFIDCQSIRCLPSYYLVRQVPPAKMEVDQGPLLPRQKQLQSTTSMSDLLTRVGNFGFIVSHSMRSCHIEFSISMSARMFI